MVACQWPIARVFATNVGADELVRVVTVKTANGAYKRPGGVAATLQELRNSELNSTLLPRVHAQRGKVIGSVVVVVVMQHENRQIQSSGRIYECYL